jgi:predicted RNA-binding Zn-ribbon protein involved in translation (DUF1610 family)
VDLQATLYYDLTMTAGQMQSATFELAGMITDQGHLGRRVDTDVVLIPDRDQMRLDADETALIYNTRGFILHDEQRPELLDTFVSLRHATAREILQFAQRYGVLSLRAIRSEGVYAEDLDTWREYIGRTQATLDIAAQLHRGGQAPPEHWERLRPWWWEGWSDFHSRIKNSSERRRIVERRQLEDVMNAWLQLAELRPYFTWRGGIVFTNLAGADEGKVTMLGVLALQLVMAVRTARAIATCDGCGRTYTRKGRLAPVGRHNYCPRCGLKAAWRDAQARRRNKATLAKKLRAQKRRRRAR